MKILSNEGYLKLTLEERERYLIKYLRHTLSSSIDRMQSSENFSSPSWPYRQAEYLGSQKILNKIIKLVSND